MATYMQTGKNTGLGDYVHLSRANYLKHGFFRTNKSGTSSSTYKEAIGITYQNLKKNIVDRVKINGNVYALEELMTAIYLQDWNNQAFMAYGVNLSQVTQQEATLKTAIESKLTADKSFDRSTMGVTTNLQATGQKLYKYRVGNKPQNISRASLLKIEASIRQHIAILSGEMSKGTVNLPRAQLTLKSLFSYSKQIQSFIQQMNSSGNMSLPVRNTMGARTLLGDIIVNLNAIKSNYGNISTTEIGTTAEIGALAAWMMIDNKKNITVNQLLSGVVGSTRSKNLTKRSNIYANYDLGDNKTVTITSSQDTVDIVMQANNNTIFGSTQNGLIGASVKSYTDLTHGIKLIGSTTLESVLNLTGSAFANHYLNRIADHYKEIGPNQYRKEAPVQSLPDGDNIVAYALAIRALTGAKQQSFNKLSNYLIVYDHTMSRVRVFSSSDLLNKICPQPGVFRYDMVNIDGLPIAAGSFDNSPKDTAEQRITLLMNAVRQKKLSMSLIKF